MYFKGVKKKPKQLELIGLLVAKLVLRKFLDLLTCIHLKYSYCQYAYDDTVHIDVRI